MSTNSIEFLLGMLGEGALMVMLAFVLGAVIVRVLER